MSQARALRGGRAFSAGHRAEWLAMAWLMLRGWRIIGFRLKTPMAEIDILALKKTTLAVVEVKQRASLEQALEAVGVDQRLRLRRAAEKIAASRPALRSAAVRLDLLALAPGRAPRHIPDAWSGQ